MLYFEKKFQRLGSSYIIGVDEVGRGPLAGPVVAAAVWLKTYRFHQRIDDSKKLTPRQREKACLEIMRKSLFGLGIISEKVIDDFNILEATRLAMEVAVTRLLAKLNPTDNSGVHILVDGQVELTLPLPYTNIIKGDSRSKSIACASIVAKVIRDRIMSIYDRVFPGYAFLRHKGYPTSLHRRLLKERGLCLIHRRSFCFTT